jgi:SAM-dependent methyltransferase
MAAAYIAQAPARVEGPMQVWLDAAVRGLSPRNTKILEVGAGSGRDALYFKARGYEIECSDSSLPFVKHLTELGLPARKIDLLVDQIGVEYDLVFANSVVCHFTKSQFSWALSSINSALVPEGRFAFTTKHSPRYEFRYAERAGMRRPFSSWPVDRLTEFLSVHGFAVDFQAVSKSLETKSDWINIVATKMGSSV